MNHAPMLDELWRARNAAAVSLMHSEEHMRRAIQAASVEDLVALIETFSPARSAGPEWTRGFEPLAERLWTWRDDITLAALAEVFRARGMAWLAVANAFSPDQGKHLRASLRRPAWARLPAFTLA